MFASTSICGHVPLQCSVPGCCYALYVDLNSSRSSTNMPLACLPHYTSGQTYFYPAFNAARTDDAVKFAHELGEVLAMPVMVEAVTRVRASRGLRMSSFHGNFFVRSTDLLAMPTVPQDTGYCIEISIEETLTQPYIVLQTAILHTTCYGAFFSCNYCGSSSLTAHRRTPYSGCDHRPPDDVEPV